ncbi:DNA phosphorothioation-dependent restriction protein DptF [Chryseobacterium sp. NRRL B-14859]|uniref:DNA phosphorothioation-dependent restriction protein DptF n=1 Tax=unclassified Chryseobacterium TaxID=2593645 RepID=UPI003342C810
MENHPLITELQKLKESSRHAIAQGDKYDLDEFKKYLHIEREVEKELKNIILKSSTSEKAQLILVCGNVGDGKSHILSYLHNELRDTISQFKIHNDATESHNPNESSNVTLYKVLNGFRDENLEQSKDKIILAINLGTLSKFIDTYSEEFTYLKEYITQYKILDAELPQDVIPDVSKNFNHINFTDYHLYSLTENGADSEVIMTILEKVITDHEANSIHRAYLDYKISLDDKIFCPILYNYEFLFNENNRLIISQLIIKAIVKSKEIVSIRTLLNFIYDILVPINLSSIKFADYYDEIGKMNADEMLTNLIPNYLFEHPELSSLFSKIESLDPCINRTAVTDDILLTLMNVEEAMTVFSDYINSNYLYKIDFLINQEYILATNLSKLFLRLNYFSNYSSQEYLRDEDYDEYMTWLFHYNNNPKFKGIYLLVENAAKNWNGNPKSNGKIIINVGKKQSQYRIFKDFKATPDLKTQNVKVKTEIKHNKFSQEFCISYIGAPKIHVDYSLFKLLKMILKGYKPNKKDNNNYVYFVDVINKLINQSKDNSTLYVDEVNIGQEIDYTFSLDEFGDYNFQMI